MMKQIVPRETISKKTCKDFNLMSFIIPFHDPADIKYSISVRGRFILMMKFIQLISIL